MIGLIIGVLGGVADALCLFALVNSITKKQKPNILFGLLFAFIPAAILLPVAVFLTDDLLWAGTGLAGALILASVVKLIVTFIRKGNDSN